MARFFKSAAAATLGALVGGAIAAPFGCNGTTQEPKEPTQLATKPRDVALSHEECDLTSKGAAGMDAHGSSAKASRPEILSVRDGAREKCRAVDVNLDGVIDVYVYYDEQGRPRRRESGFDRNDQPDEVSYFENGVLVRKERETNSDRKVDTWDYYEGGRLVREERDTTGDGYVDQWWTFNRPAKPDCALVVSDADGDGRPDPGSEIDFCHDEGPPGAPTATAEADAGAPPAATEGDAGAPPTGDQDDAGAPPAAGSAPLPKPPASATPTAPKPPASAPPSAPKPPDEVY